MTSHPETLNNIEAAQPFEYELLQGHFRTDGSFKGDEQLRSEYVQLTDELIHKMTDGVDVQNAETGEVEKHIPDYVVWLDKSARPVSWLTKELWPTLAVRPNGELPDMPSFRFANIDREQWVNTVDPEGIGHMDADRVDKSIIRSLRSVFVAPRDKQAGLTETIDEAPAELDDKTVLIVDEVRASGRTLDMAMKMFERAFPNTKFAKTHWMSGQVQLRDPRGRMIGQGNADLPVWYKEHDVKGRGVGNRNEKSSESSNSRTQRLGRWFLSTRLAEQDDASLRLRKELKQLGKDVMNHEVLVVPSLDRDMDDFEERAKRLNNISFDEFIKAKRQLAD